jgi:hypothetical protein
MDRPGIARAYLKSWFATDLISCLPLDVPEMIAGNSSLKVSWHSASPLHPPTSRVDSPPAHAVSGPSHRPPPRLPSLLLPEQSVQTIQN